MCDSLNESQAPGVKTIPVNQAVGTVLAHDITEIRPNEFKGPVFRKGHIVRAEDVCHLQRLGKEHLFVLNIKEYEMHEDEAAYELARALMGEGAAIKGGPKEGKITIVADRDGLLKINRDALFQFNMAEDVMCATIHDNSLVKKGQVIAGTRAIPLVINKKTVDAAVDAAGQGEKVIRVKELRKPRTGIVITGNEVYYGKIKDAFAPIVKKKIESFGGEVAGLYYAPDDKSFIENRLRELIDAGSDLLITTGGMSVDPDDVTRFAIKKLGASEITYGSAVLPGAMFLIAYLYPYDKEGAGGVIPVLGIPACGMYAKATVFDLVLPRILAGERIGRRDLAELGHGGLCMKCEICRYPVCPFGK